MLQLLLMLFPLWWVACSIAQSQVERGSSASFWTWNGLRSAQALEGGDVATKNGQARPASAKIEQGWGERVRIDAVTVGPSVNPLSLLNREELDTLIRSKPEGLGSLSIGVPTRGALLNAVQLTDSDAIEIIHPDRAFGTFETVYSLNRAAAFVREKYPEGDRLKVGDLSRENGGYLRPHRSHQSGCDADVGYFYLDPDEKWYTKATAENLDRARTWSLLKALIAQGNVEYIFADRSVQRLLAEHAESLGEDGAWLTSVFQERGRKDTILRHTWGHITHFHVRFHNEEAKASSRYAYARLAKLGKLQKPWRFKARQRSKAISKRK